MSFEEKMKQDLKKDLEIPEIVEQKIQDAYKEIGQGKRRMKKPDNRNQKRKKVWTAPLMKRLKIILQMCRLRDQKQKITA